MMISFLSFLPFFFLLFLLLFFFCLLFWWVFSLVFRFWVDSCGRQMRIMNQQYWTNIRNSASVATVDHGESLVSTGVFFLRFWPNGSRLIHRHWWFVGCILFLPQIFGSCPLFGHIENGIVLNGVQIEGFMLWVAIIRVSKRQNHYYCFFFFSFFFAFPKETFVKHFNLIPMLCNCNVWIHYLFDWQ